MIEEYSFNKIWQNDPTIIKRFIENRLNYEQLCTEISYILEKGFSDKKIKVASVSHRAKTLNSFLEKIYQKNYKDPFEEITDFAGVRVVYLYQSDLSNIETIINHEFFIEEKVDKLNEKRDDEFGYIANHYIVQLGKHSSGARYDDLKDLKCEIQVRTVLQDAWAIINHHLVYKKEAAIPTILQRKLNSLAGVFETADDQFESIRTERERYLNQLNESSQSNKLLENEINFDTIVKYLQWKFPDVKSEKSNDQINYIVRDLLKLNFKKLRELDNIVEKRMNQFPDIINTLNEYGWDTFKNGNYSSATYIGLLLLLDVKDWLEQNHYTEYEKNCFKDLRKEFPLTENH
ncbi:MAG: hypothetical protein WKF97_02540 [Chitinophagaceae bacterium]